MKFRCAAVILIAVRDGLMNQVLFQTSEGSEASEFRKHRFAGALDE